MPMFIIVITFIFFVFFQLFSEQNRKEALNANKMLSLQAMRLVDTSLKVIDNMVVLETINSKPLKDFFKSGTTGDPYINISAVQKLKEMINYYPLIDSIYLVRYSDGFVLSDATNSFVKQYPDQTFIEQYQISKTPKWTDGRTFEQFKRIGGKQVVSLVRGSPYMKNDQGMIVINVATDTLNKLTRDLYDSKVSFIQVTDTTDNMLFGSPIQVKDSEIYSQYVSSYSKWKYGSGLVHGGFVHIISSLYNVWFVIGLLMIALGLIWMIYVSRRNSRPIEQIAARFSGYSLPVSGGGSKRGAPDEFAFIESALDNILEQSKQYQQKYQEDLHLRTRFLFHQLIEGGSALTQSDWELQALQLKLPLPLGLYRILVVEIDKYGDFCSNFSKGDQDLLKFTLRSVVGEIASKLESQQWSEWTSASNLSVMLFEKGDVERGEQSILLQLVDQIRAWTEQNLKFTITIGIGHHAETIQGIPKSYKGAMEALKYKIVLGENRWITSDDIASQSQAEIYSHLGAIRSIAQSFRMLENNWSDQYDEWFVQLKHGRLTNDEIVNLMNYLIYYFGREMSTANKNYHQIWIQEGLPKLSEQMDNDYSLDHLRDETKQVLQALYVSLQQLQDESQHASLIRDIRKYMERDYANPNMSLEWLGEQFHINPKYVSRLFKENTGQKFVDFLIDLRMQEAQRLLVETNDAIQEIAEQVGYTSAISFSRVFKKITGYSPGEYRTERTRRANG
ncbi:AraC family transcriptional regulator [Paenibacillus selenitireducens]|uniref:AraC family transcriptional regulator n=2 Tax=Paenibacillus selenitireducens TaxID=1324314 RepID=A0A1T2XB01_9BACL|nr:AraC family transcriptional regulator [Paenibacillus selenitireducens]